MTQREGRWKLILIVSVISSYSYYNTTGGIIIAAVPDSENAIAPSINDPADPCVHVGPVPLVVLRLSPVATAVLLPLRVTSVVYGDPTVKVLDTPSCATLTITSLVPVMGVNRTPV